MQFISLETGLAQRNNGSSSKFLRCSLSYSRSSSSSSLCFFPSPSSLSPSSSSPSIHRLASQLFSASSLWLCYYHLPASIQFINTLHSAFPLEIYFIIIFAPVLCRCERRVAVSFFIPHAKYNVVLLIQSCVARIFVFCAMG